jgi:hypothetical protein
MSQAAASGSDELPQFLLLLRNCSLESSELDLLLAQVKLQIEPVLIAARSALNVISKNDLTELRALRQPPALVHTLMCGVLALMGENDTSWANMKKFLASGETKAQQLRY